MSDRDDLLSVIPQTYGEAIELYSWLDCQPHEWDNRTTAENAIWLINKLASEYERLHFMIQYALDGPDDWHAVKSILFDTVNGCSGADNLEEVRAKFGMYQAR